MRAPSDRRSAAIGGLASWLVFCRLLLWNWSLRWPDALGGMFDSQARAFANGHLDIRDDSLGFEAFVIGLKTGTLNLSLLNDYAAGALNSLIGVAGSVVPVGSSSLLYVEVRRTSNSRSSSNPGFICAVLNRNFQTFNASVGEVPTCAWNPQITGGYAELAA